MAPTSSFIRSLLTAAIRESSGGTMSNQSPPLESPPTAISSDDDLRNMLGDILIESNNEWSEHFMNGIDKLYYHDRLEEQKRGEWTAVKDIPVFATINKTKIKLWQGDITRLQTDAIVNAANEQGLGCFIPQHKCIDNVIHRRSGPRLRQACRQEMQKRTTNSTKPSTTKNSSNTTVSPLLKAGAVPIVTNAFHLPSQYVIHVTGPQVSNGIVKAHHQKNLAKAYEGILNTCLDHGIKSVAFPCISTGLFGYPAKQAAKVALETVMTWLQNHPNNNTIDTIVFDVYTSNDLSIYQQKMEYYFQKTDRSLQGEKEVFGKRSYNLQLSNLRELSLHLAHEWIKNADAVLIVAGAGMSVKDGEMVYVNHSDFAKHFPYFLKWGYKTAYETMGLFQNDNRVPITAKWAYQAKHMHLMRWGFTPNQGYTTLLNMVQDKNYFVLTSNVDGCFERSGFNVDRIYTPQGEWTFMQCLNACQPDSIFDAKPIIDHILPHIISDDNCCIPEHLVPKCPNCGGDLFGNVRGGEWFMHQKYEQQNDNLRNWMNQLVVTDPSKNNIVPKKVAVIEIGAGYNTPMVTRFPAESFVRQLGKDRGCLIRINPTDAIVPGDINAISIDEGWQVLDDIFGIDDVMNDYEESNSELMNILQRNQYLDGKTSNVIAASRVAQYFGHFDWNIFLSQLKNK